MSKAGGAPGSPPKAACRSGSPACALATEAKPKGRRGRENWCHLLWLLSSALFPAPRYVPTLLLWLPHLFIIFLDDPHTLPIISCLRGNVFVDAGSQAAISAVPTVLPPG